MMTTARIPLEPFLPVGSLDSDTNSLGPAHIPSVVSPLTLPRGETGVFDPLSVTSHPASQSPHFKPDGINGVSQSRNRKACSPSSPSIRGPPQAQPGLSLSPDLAPVRETHHHFKQLRSSSLSSDHRALPLERTLYHREPFESLAAGHYSLPGDFGNDQSSAHTIHRLLQQNARVRGAWEAERKYLEANRERAEEVYREERIIMEEERLAWDAERAQLLQQVEVLGRERVGWESERSRLLQQIQCLQTRVLALESWAHGHFVASVRGPSSGIPLRDNSASGDAVGGGDASHEVGGSTFHPLMNASNMNNLGAFESATTSSPDQLNSNLCPPSMGLGIPGPFSPASNPMAPSGQENGPVPVVDVREIHPELEGIPIKANAIQRPTFRDGPSPIGSRATSRTGSPTEAQRSPLDKHESREQTLKTLAAPETVRLTMHAGHTPNHSMSIVPTGMVSAISTAASSGGCTTPLASQNNMLALKDDFADEDDRRDSSVSISEPVEPAPSNHAQVDSADGPLEPLMDPTQDRELRAPLMIRNIPATDEIFLRRLSDKLEEIRRSPEIAVPAVLKDALLDDGSSDFTLASPPMVTGAVAEVAAEATTTRCRSPQNDDELEIPLRIKKSSNFGAPFGECG